MEMDVRQIGSHLLYGIQTGGHSYGFGLNVFPFDLPLLKYGTEPPNYTTPAGTSAVSLAFAIKYKRATGTAGMTTHNMKLLGSKCNTTELSVSSQGLVTATQEWISREITTPASGDISGATWPTFGSITITSTIKHRRWKQTINNQRYKHMQ